MKAPESFTPQELLGFLLREALQPPVSEVCSMRDDGYGECWGCPAIECVRHLTPFEDAAVDREVLRTALERLKNNAIWLGRVPGREVYEALVNEGTTEGALGELMVLLIEHREDYLVNLAVERAAMGLESEEDAASRVGWAGHNKQREKNITSFKQRVKRRMEERLGATAAPMEGRTRRISHHPDDSDERDGTHGRESLKASPSLSLRDHTVSRRIKRTDGRWATVQGAPTWEEVMGDAA